MHNIQINKIESIKLKASAYVKMDESELRLYGLSPWRMNLVKGLRKMGYSLYQIIITTLFALVILASLATHDAYYEDRAEQYIYNKYNDDSDSSIA